MLSRFVFCTLLVGCLAAPDRSKRSINGTRVSEHPYSTDYPYMIEVLKKGSHLRCGALIKPNIALGYIFSRINCNEEVDASPYELLAGNQILEDRKSPFVQVRQVEKIVTWSHDFCNKAMMKTTKPFDLNNYVNVIKTPHQGFDDSQYMARKAVILGWGGSKTNLKHLTKMYAFIKDFKCGHHQFKMVGLNGSTVGNGDMGGPVVIQGKERKDDVLIGLVDAFIYPGNDFLAINLVDLSYWIYKTARNLNR